MALSANTMTIIHRQSSSLSSLLILLLTTLLLLLLPLSLQALVLPPETTTRRRTRSCSSLLLRHGAQQQQQFLLTTTTTTRPPPLLLYAKSNRMDADEDDEENEQQQTGMARAFQELDELKSLDDDDDDDDRTTTIRRRPSQSSSSSSTTIKVDTSNVDQNNLRDNTPRVSPEAEVKLYSDMYKEVSEKDDDQVYADMMTDMSGGKTSVPPVSPPPSSSSSSKKKPTTVVKVQDESDDDETVELLDSLIPQRTPEDIDIFLNKALQEALEEARTKTPRDMTAADNPLDDEEMMEEIKQVFERANEELLNSLEDIRKEQADLAKATAERNAQARMDAEADNEERLRVAQASMEKMLKKVNDETLEVERAVRDLKAAQDEMSADPLYRLKSGGIVKQGALVGTVLFSSRAIGEVLAMSSTTTGDGYDAHVLPALIQGAIAFVCAAYFFFL